MTPHEPPAVALADPGIGEPERLAVDRVMRSGWISMGAETVAFESELAAAHGVDDAVAVNSGTAALHLALCALGVGPGDEVVVPSLTFVATAAAVLMVGARPVFADVVGSSDLTVDPAHVRAALSPRTRAVIAVHYAGGGARMGELQALAGEAGVALVEDAAHAPAVATPAGVLGTIGDVGCFSFHAAKNMTTGEGGMVVARDPEVLGRVRALRSHGFVMSSGPHSSDGAPTRDVPGVGFNYRPTDLAAAVGRAQLARLDRERAARQALTDEYCRLLGDLPVALAFEPGAPSAHHLLPILLPPGVDRSRVQARLREAGIHTAVHYPPVHRYSAYRDAGIGPAGLARTEAVSGRLLSLPLHGRLGAADARRVVGALDGALSAAPGGSVQRGIGPPDRPAVPAAPGPGAFGAG